ncbi:MAG: DUF3486 family protein [Rhizobiaceae bacterium]|nr:DUF3486 family protein [Rhizobiaceae bacterium]
MKDRKQVRRSGIDLLPPETVPDLQWAFDRLVEGRMTQGEVLSQLNRLLAARGQKGVSSSSFNRWFLRIRAGEADRPLLVDARPHAEPSLIRAETRRLLAAALRSLANDLDPAAGRR